MRQPRIAFRYRQAAGQGTYRSNCRGQFGDVVTARMVVAAAAAGVIIAGVILLAFAWIGPPT